MSISHPVAFEPRQRTNAVARVMAGLRSGAHLLATLSRRVFNTRVCFFSVQTVTIALSTALTTVVLIRSVNAGEPREYEQQFGRSVLHPGGEVTDVALSPDGRLVASASHGPVRIWETETGTLVREFANHANGDSGRRVVFSPDGQLLASGGEDWTVRIWDVQSGRQLHVLHGQRFGLLGIVHPIQIAFSPDGMKLVSGAHDGVVQVWDVESGTQIIQIPKQIAVPFDPVVETLTALALDIHPDGRTVAVAGSDQMIHLVDTVDESTFEVIRSEFTRISDLTFSPDGERLAWCGRPEDMGKTGIVVWNLREKRIEQRLGEHEAGRVHGVAFSPDGSRLVSCGFGNAIKLWDVHTWKQVWTGRGHTATPWKVDYAADGSCIASCGSDGRVRLWDAQSGEERAISRTEGNGASVGVGFKHDGMTIVAGYSNGTVAEWNSDGTLARRFSMNIDDLAQYRSGFAISASGQLAAASHDSTVSVWDVSTGSPRWSQSEFRPLDFELTSPSTHHVVFSRDGRYLSSLTTSDDDPQSNRTVIRVWDVATGTLLSQLNISGHVWSAPAFAPDGESFALNCSVISVKNLRLDESRIENYQTVTGNRLKQFRSEAISGACLIESHDGNAYVTGTSRSRLQFRDAASGELQFSLQGPHYGANYSTLVISTDGRRIAASSSYQVQRTYVWTIADGRLTHCFPHGSQHLAFSPAGDKLLAGQPDGTLLLWDLETAPAAPDFFRNLTPEELKQRWTQLGQGRDSSRGNAGNAERIQALVEGGNGTVAFLKTELLRPDADDHDRREAHALVAPLADPDPEIRLATSRRLDRFGDDAWRILSLFDLGEEAASDDLLSALESAIARGLGSRRNGAAYDVLKQIATPEAMEVLKEIAETLPDAPQNRNRKLLARYAYDELQAARIRRPE